MVHSVVSAMTGGELRPFHPPCDNGRCSPLTAEFYGLAFASSSSDKIVYKPVNYPTARPECSDGARSLHFQPSKAKRGNIKRENYTWFPNIFTSMSTHSWIIMQLIIFGLKMNGNCRHGCLCFLRNFQREAM